MRFVVTAGPTREYIDSVRFVSNASSGKMGVALAEAALSGGHDVVLVHGPVTVGLPAGIKCIPVESTDEMIDAVLSELLDSDVLVSVAAIADYTPAKKLNEKIKSGGDLTLRLKPTRKLTRLAKQEYPSKMVVAFKAEYSVSEEELVERAYSKLKGEGLDLVIANDVGRNKFGSEENQATVVYPNHNVKRLGKKTKKELAEDIVSLIEDYLR